MIKRQAKNYAFIPVGSNVAVFNAKIVDCGPWYNSRKG